MPELRTQKEQLERLQVQGHLGLQSEVKVSLGNLVRTYLRILWGRNWGKWGKRRRRKGREGEGRGKLRKEDVKRKTRERKGERRKRKKKEQALRHHCNRSTVWQTAKHTDADGSKT